MLIVYSFSKSDWLYTEAVIVRIINYLFSSANLNNENLYKRFARITNISMKYLEPPIKNLRIFSYRIYIYIGNKKIRLQIHKMILEAYIDRHYGYKGIHSNIYLVRID